MEVSAAAETKGEYQRGRQRPRVLHVVRSLEVGGLERVVCQLVRARGFDATAVACLVARGEFANGICEEGGRVYDVSYPTCGSFRRFIRLLGVVREFRPAVIHCHNMYAHSYGAGVGRLLGIPVVLTKHGTHFPRSLGATLLHKRLLRQTRVVAVSAEIVELVRSWAPSGRQPVLHIGNGMMVLKGDRERVREAVRGRMGWTDEDWVFVTVSRVVPGKRIDQVLNAFARIRDYVPRSRIIVVGDGSSLGSLREQVEALGVEESVLFLGQRMDVDDLLCASDVFVLASDNEGLPMALLEAMAAGLPSIVTDVGEMPIVVNDGETGLVVPVSSSVELGEAMRALWDDKSRAKAMGERGRERVKELFGIGTVVSRYEVLYEGLIRKS